ncbi:multi-sensor hybrid histidine kinase [Candidatus Magnetominusculus xianensis]|uniref:Multi-sensor hybrid histidine kinase n=1 Tax=Candidatus Magnetominusculus xianensis TaxID=1748249 RepID=A0ABR5SCR1_9BACT|nr:multi-sensor hybrid histidine kinase [Candidatus Magnetominusculus xianensis]
MADLPVPGSGSLVETQSCSTQTSDCAYRGNILFMDDDGDIRDATCELLQHFGFSVALAEDGSQAISIYEKAIANNAVFDVVILDLVVPRGLGAKDTIARLKTLDPSVKALVASGYSNDYILDNYKEFGFSGTLAKPYNFEELLGAISALLSHMK